MIVSPSGAAPGRSRLRVVALVLVTALFLALVIAAPVLAEDLTAEQEALAKKIEGKLIAPC